MFDKANEPAKEAGGRPKPVDLVDRLLIIRILEHSDDNPMGLKRKRKNAETGEEFEVPADCVLADVVDLDTEDQPAHYDYVFLQAKLIQHFKTNVGSTLIGMIGKHPNVGERQGAYYFTDRINVARERAVAEAWVANHPEFFGSQAPGNSARKSNAPTGNGGSESESDAGGSTLDRMRASGNNSEEAPF